MASSAEATVLITINPMNEGPIAQADAGSTLKNTAVNISVVANDVDPDGDHLTVQSVTQGANGTVTINSDGKGVNYRPKPSFVGTDTFMYTVSDGKGGAATASVTVTVLRR